MHGHHHIRGCLGEGIAASTRELGCTIVIPFTGQERPPLLSTFPYIHRASIMSFNLRVRSPLDFLGEGAEGVGRSVEAISIGHLTNIVALPLVYRRILLLPNPSCQLSNLENRDKPHPAGICRKMRSSKPLVCTY